MSTTASVVDLTSFPDVAWANQGQLCQSPLCREKAKATPNTKSWEKMGKLFGKLGTAFQHRRRELKVQLLSTDRKHLCFVL